MFVSCSASCFVIIVVTALVSLGDSARILGVFPTPSKSHLIVHMAVVNALVEKGHDVTVLTQLPTQKSSGFRHIQIKTREMSKDMIKDNMKGETSGLVSKIINAMKSIKQMMEIPNDFLKDPKLKRLMDEESFDLIVHGYFFNDFQIGLAQHFKCPIVLIWTGRTFASIDQLIGNPSEYLYVPSAVMGGTQPLKFFDRVKSVLSGVLENLLMIVYNYLMESYYVENFPPDKYPPYSTAMANVSLVLANHHFSEGPIKSDIPAVIEIGGIQVKSKPDPLPTEVKKILDGASANGAIYFSLGSNARSADLKPETLDLIYKVLSSLKQQVIWKWETDDLPGNAENIYFGKWLPQDDILAHPNVKLFVTHGGKGSVVESEYHGVPMVGLPIFADQSTNIENMKNAGFGLGLDLPTLKEHEFKNAITEVLDNKKYSMAVKRFSEIYKDRPLTAKENAVFWIEYAIRHRGAPHIQSPLKYMNVFQRNGLDVLAFILGAIYVLIKVIKFSFKTLWRLIFGSKTKPRKSKSE